MKRNLFYTFLLAFIITFLVTFLGVIKVISIDDFYLKALFGVLLLQTAGAVIGLFKKTNFFVTDSPHHADKNMLRYYEIENYDCATLNGFVEPEGNIAYVWFEWGETPNLGYSTEVQTFTQNSSVSQQISKLKENTIYFYRIMIQTKKRLVESEIISFKTAKIS